MLRLDDAQMDAARKALLEALRANGIDENALAEAYSELLESTAANPKERRLALKDLTELLGCLPRKRTEVSVQSEQRALSIVVGDGAAALGGVDPERLRALPPAERRAALELLSKLGLRSPALPVEATVAEGIEA